MKEKLKFFLFGQKNCAMIKTCGLFVTISKLLATTYVVDSTSRRMIVNWNKLTKTKGCLYCCLSLLSNKEFCIPPYVNKGRRTVLCICKVIVLLFTLTLTSIFIRHTLYIVNYMELNNHN